MPLWKWIRQQAYQAGRHSHRRLRSINRATFPSLEVFERRCLLSGTSTDLILNNVSADGRTGLTIQYSIEQSTGEPFDLGFYSSINSGFDPGVDSLISSIQINQPGDLTTGFHQKQLVIGTDVQFPGGGLDEWNADTRLLLVLDPTNLIVEADQDPFNEDNCLSFHGVYHVSGEDLVVIGDDASDNITVSMVSTNEISVSAFGISYHYSTSDIVCVQVLGGLGNDTIDASGSTIPVQLWGGLGNDSLFGGNQSDYLNGGSSDDILKGGDGTNILIGGDGTDHLFGGLNSDLIIGGDLFLKNSGDLRSILAEWSSATPLPSRVDHLSGVADGGANGNVLINYSTLADDGLYDAVTGGGGSDWLVDRQNSAVTPTPPSAAMRPVFDAINARARQGNVDLLFLGDSITQGFQTNPIWQQYIGDGSKVMDAGVGGDRTGNVLWRLDHGNIDGIHPKLIVLEIGTNNSNGSDNTAQEIADGIKAIITQLRLKLPDSKILLMSIFPRGASPSPQRDKNAEASEIASQLADGSNVFSLDIANRFLGSNGTLSTSIFPDLLHPNTAGYLIWADAIRPFVAEFLDKSQTSVSLSLMQTGVPGSPVMISATVTTPSDASARANGSVIFYDGKTAIGTTTLTDGIATLTTSSLSFGTHSILAVYQGDRSFVGSTSPIASAFVGANPTLLSLSTPVASYPSKTVVGTFISSVIGIQRRLAYTLIGGPGGQDNSRFRIDSGGNLITQQSIDLSTGNSLSVRVRTTDEFGFASEQVFGISADHANESPVTTVQSFKLVENRSVSSPVGTVAAADPDVGQIQTFAITAGNIGNAFAINPSTGAITVATSSAIDFETTPRFSLTVQITDNGVPALSTTVTVIVDLTNVNEAPNVAKQSFNLPENSPSGTTVGRFVAVDPDAGQTLTYALLPGTNSDAFEVNAVTGEITVTNSSILNFEVTPRFQLIIEVSDNGSPSLSKTGVATINLTNVNEAPLIEKQAFTVAENRAAGSALGRVIATDPDANQSRSFTLIAGNVNNAFAINSTSGFITVVNTAALDFESTPTFSLTVHVTDNGSPALSAVATVTVSLSDVNEAPISTNQSFQLPENSPNGTTVGILSAKDPDFGQVLTYTIVSGNTGSAFAINPITGEITVANGVWLNFEVRPKFQLSIKISDGGIPSLSKTIAAIVNLSNVNDAPVITGVPASVTFSKSAGKPILLAPSAAVVDEDSTSFSLLTLDLGATARSEDSLTIRNQGTGATQIGVSGSTITFSGIPIGTFSGGTDSIPLTILLNSSASTTAVRTLLRNLQFSSASNSAVARSLSIQLTDSGSATSSRVNERINMV